jgi:tRNA (guanine37-N1)-methyltransferase
MTIDIITLFPAMFAGPFNESIVKRAQDKSLVTINIHNLRKWAVDKRGTVDDKPYGGGTGMLLRPEPIFNAVEEIKSQCHPERSEGSHSTTRFFSRRRRDQNDRKKIVLLDAGGILYNQKKAQEYSKLDQLILICGHYEGVDYRVHEFLADETLSTGDYVLTGGELPAMTVVDSVVRLIPGVLEKEDATIIESFNSQQSVVSNQETTSLNRKPTTENQKLVEFPQYTRPEKFQHHAVPDILLSGNHAEIEKWRKEQAEKRTKINRPDLLNLP